MVSFDGFRHDYADRVSTPNFDRFAQEGTKSEGLIPIFPSLTFPNHYSIATGSYSGTHNITGNSFYDKEMGEKYNFRDKNTVRNSKFYKSEPIWVTAERQGVKSASFYWVGSEAPIKGYSPSIFKHYDGSVPFRSRIDSVISWFQLPQEKRPRLIMLYFSEPDYAGHDLGASHSSISSVISEMDSLLGYLMKELRKLHFFSKLNIILLSDHGMTNVSSERIIILDDYISHLDEYVMDGIGSHVQFDLIKFADEHIQKFQDELSNIPHSQFWSKADIPLRFHFNNANTGDYLLLADEGWFITTKLKLEKNEFLLGGMHGYDPYLPSMHGIFYAFGINIRSGMQIPKFENIHIYPIICRLLGISPYGNEKDGPAGDGKILEPMLINIEK